MPGMTYTVIKVADAPIGGILERPADYPAEAPNLWSAYVTVTDIEATVAGVVRLGGKVRCRRSRFPKSVFLPSFRIRKARTLRRFSTPTSIEREI